LTIVLFVFQPVTDGFRWTTPR